MNNFFFSHFDVPIGCATNLIFPGGEVLVQMPQYKFDPAFRYHLTARVQNSDDLMSLVMLKDAYDRVTSAELHLFLPYVPYARQDRVCNPGESHSLKAFARIINSLNFASVTVLDPHSSVVEAVIDRLRVITQSKIIQNHRTFISHIETLDQFLFVSPDAGANKKTADVAKIFSCKRFLRADKLRDLSTGNIIETVVYEDDLTGVDVVILDDICDGGRTFIELARVLKKKNARRVDLFVTHGIFSQGVENLLKNGIDRIFTTNSFNFNRKNPTADPRVSVLDVAAFFQ